MLLMAIAAVAFGLYAAHRFSAAPFVAANVVVAIAIVIFGLANGWSVGRILAALVVTFVCLQAAFLLGTVRKAFGRKNADVLDGRPALPRDSSTIDRTR